MKRKVLQEGRLWVNLPRKDGLGGPGREPVGCYLDIRIPVKELPGDICLGEKVRLVIEYHLCRNQR